jgi:hypothetical protein
MAMSGSTDRHWKFWLTLPLYPFSQRRTICRELVRGEVWALEQVQGLLYVVTPIRMTIVRLGAGGLLVYAPIAPTGECLHLVNQLVEQYGGIKYIVLPTVSGLEHKVFAGPFARKFPSADVYVAPHQWSFPLNLPLNWLGLPGNRTHRLPANSTDPVVFGDEFDYAVLGPIHLGLGAFEEVALFHRRSRTLLVTDTIVSIPVEPPEIIAQEVTALLFHARDHGAAVVADTSSNRLKGWQRIALFSFYFRPGAAQIVGLKLALQAARQAPDRSRQNYFGFYPFDWQENWHKSFEQLCGGGRLLVAPILQRLILNRDPQRTIAWADRVAQWPFEQIISCHLEAPIVATPAEFRAAFAFLEKQPQAQNEFPLEESDLALIYTLEDGLNRIGIVPPAQEKI